MHGKQKVFSNCCLHLKLPYWTLEIQPRGKKNSQMKHMKIWLIVWAHEITQSFWRFCSFQFNNKSIIFSHKFIGSIKYILKVRYHGICLDVETGGSLELAELQASPTWQAPGQREVLLKLGDSTAKIYVFYINVIIYCLFCWSARSEEREGKILRNCWVPS